MQAANGPPPGAGTTAPTTGSTASTPTEPKHAARRKGRREEGDRKRRRRQEQSTVTETTPEPLPNTTEEPAPPEPEPEPQPEQESDGASPERLVPPDEDEPHALHIVEKARLKLVKREGITYWQEGPVRGTLSGTLAVRVTIGGPGVTSTFTVTLRDGTVRGRGEARIRPDGSVVHYKGTASITGGTGKYADASGRNLRYSGTGASDASTATARLTGTLRY